MMFKWLIEREESRVCYQQRHQIEEELQEKVRRFGYWSTCGGQINWHCFDLSENIHQDEIYGSAYASAVYLSSVMKLPKDQKVYVIGMSGLEEELSDEGVSFIGGTVGAWKEIQMT